MGKRNILVISVLSAVLALPFTAQAKPGFYPTRFARQGFGALNVQNADGLSGAAQGKVLYYGGPVISHAKIYAVNWGPNVDQTTQKGIGGFYTVVTNSTYLDWLTEYDTNLKAVDGRDGTDQTIGRGQYAGMITITPTNTNTKIDDVDIQAELQKQIDAGVLPKPDEDTLFMIYFPPGITITASGATSCMDFCAYHGFKGTPDSAHFFYGVMPDIGGACGWGCSNGGTAFDSLTSISSHEMMEAITDPFPTPGSTPAYPQAWNDSQGNEIGDLCVGGDGSVQGAGATYAVQAEWDNAANACTANQAWTSP